LLRNLQNAVAWVDATLEADRFLARHGDAKLVRACLLDVFQEVNGEQAVDALLDKLGM